MNYAVDMASGAIVYIPSFVKAGWFCHSKVDGIHRHTVSMVIVSAYFYFFKIRKVG
jgi:hypothetical protein